jgi:hypothetical protein
MGMGLHYHQTFNNWTDENAATLQFGNQKVAFDGYSRIIYIASGVTDINAKEDIYEAWKEWVLASPEQGTGMTWPKALSVLGGDPVTDVQNVGTTLFLENGWRIQPAASGDAYTLTVVGNLYTRETGENPFLFAEGVSTSLVRSNIVDLITIEAASVAITQADIDAIVDSVWDEQLADHRDTGTTGKKLGRIATKVQDIALR